MARKHSKPHSRGLIRSIKMKGILSDLRSLRKTQGQRKHITLAMPIPLKPTARHSFFFLHLAHIISPSKSGPFLHLIAWSSGTWDPTLFSVKPSGSKHETPMHLRHIAGQVDGLRLVLDQCHVWSFTKNSGFGWLRGFMRFVGFVSLRYCTSGASQFLPFLFYCCIQRNLSRDLRKAQKKSGKAKLSMVLVYTSSKAVKEVASKKSHQAWRDFQVWNLLFYVAIFGFCADFGVMKEVRDEGSCDGWSTLKLSGRKLLWR